MLFPIADVNEFRQRLAAVKKEHPRPRTIVLPTGGAWMEIIFVLQMMANLRDSREANTWTNR
jgi:hypothetical protein